MPVRPILSRLLPTLAASPPLVLVVGATGSGKSRLAIDLAVALGGEVVNADVIQMYAGLDVASAKVPPAERRGVPHHLMSFLPPEATFTVRDFAHVARAAVRDITARGRLPVVVGGTMYYCQALMRDSLLEEDERAAAEEGAGGCAGAARAGADAVAEEAPSAQLRALDERQESPTREARVLAEATGSLGAALPALPATQALPASPATQALPALPATEPAALSAETPYERLCRVDPVMAQRLHPHDVRKIARALEVHDSTGGVAYSTVLQRQQRRLELGVGAGAGSGGGAGRDAISAAGAASTLVTSRAAADLSVHTIWLSVSDEATHASRLEARVDTMLAEGLVGEVRALRAYLRGRTARCGGGPGEAAGAEPALASLRGGDQPSELTLRCLAGHMQPRRSSVGQAPAASAAAGSGICGGAAGTAGDAPCDGAGAPSVSAENGGLLQAIGYKEFSAYLDLLESAGSRARGDAAEAGHGAPLAGAAGASGGAAPAAATLPTEASEATIAAALAAGVEAVKRATRQYARKQVRWIRNRFLARGVAMTRLDTSRIGASAAASSPALASESGAPTHVAPAAKPGGDVGQSWSDAVLQPAISSVSAWLARGAESAGEGGSGDSGSGGAAVPATVADTDAARIFAWRKHSCDACGRTLNGDKEWAEHLRSRGHNAALRHATQRERLRQEHGIELPLRRKEGRGAGRG